MSETDETTHVGVNLENVEPPTERNADRRPSVLSESDDLVSEIDEQTRVDDDLGDVERSPVRVVDTHSNDHSESDEHQSETSVDMPDEAGLEEIPKQSPVFKPDMSVFKPYTWEVRNSKKIRVSIPTKHHRLYNDVNNFKSKDRRRVLEDTVFGPPVKGDNGKRGLITESAKKRNYNYWKALGRDLSKPFKGRPASPPPPQEGFTHHQIYSIINHEPEDDLANATHYEVVFNDDRENSYQMNAADIDAPQLLELYREWNITRIGPLPTVRCLGTGAVTRSQRLGEKTGLTAANPNIFTPSRQIVARDFRSKVEKLISRYHEEGKYNRIIGFRSRIFEEIGSRIIESQFLSEIRPIFEGKISNGYQFFPYIIGYHNGNRVGGNILRSDPRYERSITGHGNSRNALSIAKLLKDGDNKVSVLFLSFSQSEKNGQIHVVLAEIRPNYFGMRNLHSFLSYLNLFTVYFLMMFTLAVYQHDPEIERNGFKQLTAPIQRVLKLVRKGRNLKYKHEITYGTKVGGSECLERCLLLVADKLDGKPSV